MNINRLMSAAQAAGYAMAAEDVAENRVAVRVRPSRALAVRVERAPVRLSVYLRRLWHHGWVADHWPGRATA